MGELGEVNTEKGGAESGALVIAEAEHAAAADGLVVVCSIENILKPSLKCSAFFRYT